MRDLRPFRLDTQLGDPPVHVGAVEIAAPHADEGRDVLELAPRSAAVRSFELGEDNVLQCRSREW